MPNLLRCASLRRPPWRVWLPVAALAAGCADVVVEPSGGGGGGPAGGGAIGGAGTGGSATAGTIDIEVIDERGVPAVGLEVLSHTAEGTFVARAMTSADGTAMIELPPGGLVSVLFDRHNPLIEGEERSIQSVKPPAGRESLRFVAFESQPDDSGPTMGPVVIDYGPLAPGQNFFLVASCARELELDYPAANQLALENYRGCPQSDVFDIYAYRVLFDGPNIVVTDTAAITGQPFAPGEGAELAFEWQPVAFAETVWHLTDTTEATSAVGSAWWLVEQPYVLVPEVATQAPFDPLASTFTQQTATLLAERQCVSLGLEQDGNICATNQRTVCGEVAPADIDWSPSRLVVPVLNASTEAWTLPEGELGDYFEIRTSWPASDAGYVSWSLQVSNDVATRPTAVELPDDLIERFGPADDEPGGVFVNNVDVDSLDGFDAVLDAHGASPLLPGGRPISRESVYQRPCPD